MERVELGPGARVYIYDGSHQLVIVAEPDGSIREGRSRVFVPNEAGQFCEWRLRDVLPESGYAQLNVIDPSDHDHGATMFVWEDRDSVTFMGRDYHPLVNFTDDHIMVVPFPS